MKMLKRRVEMLKRCGGDDGEMRGDAVEML